MRKILFITLISLIAFTSCEKYSLDHAEQGGTSTDGGNVIVHISDMGATPYSRITYSFFHAGSKIKNINQTADDSHFGHVSLSLDEGIYQFVAIAHCGNGNATVSSPEKVTFYKNKVTDTAHYYGYLEVTGDETETSISLKRSVAKIRLHIKDNIPSTAKRIKCYYTGGSSTLDATSGYGCVNIIVRYWLTASLKVASTLPNEPQGASDMKIKDGFVMREVAGQHVAIATGEASKTFHGMVKLNATGAHIWQGIAKGETIEQIANSLVDAYQVSSEQAAQDVAAFVAKMKEQGLVE